MQYIFLNPEKSIAVFVIFFGQNEFIYDIKRPSLYFLEAFSDINAVYSRKK